ncbi:MAG: ribonuclease III [Bacilli bacterium]|nr:ribonuclease III [Bacilli bacterium]
MINNKDINVLVLAYLGDNVYEYYVRRYLIEQKISNVDALQKTSVNYVSAKNQAMFLEKLINNNYFDEEELSIIKRARNNKGHGHPKNCDIVTYKHATALEALIGYLKLEGKEDRIENIMELILGGSLC